MTWYMVWCNSVADNMPAYTMQNGTYVKVGADTTLPCFAWINIDATNTNKPTDVGYRFAHYMVAVDKSVVWGSTEFGFPEDSPMGTLVGTVGTGQPGFTYESTDLEELGFILHPVSGEIRIGHNMRLDYETLPVKHFTIHAKRIGSTDIESCKCIINATDVNEAPRITNNDRSVVFSFGLNKLNNMGVGRVLFQVRTYDPDVSDVAEFKIVGGNGSDFFEIANDGVVSIAKLFTESNEYHIDVEVTDVVGLKDMKRFTVHVQ